MLTYAGLASAYSTLEAHIRRAMHFRFGVGMIDTLVAKYMATVVGYYIVSRPLLDLTNPRYVYIHVC